MRSSASIWTRWLINGDKFESSRDRGQTFGFVLGRGEVIKGWDEGVLGTWVGGLRKRVIPPSLAYGREGGRDSEGRDLGVRSCADRGRALSSSGTILLQTAQA